MKHELSDQRAEAICKAIREGKSLDDLVDMGLSPTTSQIGHWCEQHEDFAVRYARARESAGDVFETKILAVLDAVTPETWKADRVKIDGYKWLASKRQPKVYGDKVDVNHSGELGIRDLSDEQLQAERERLSAAIREIEDSRRGALPAPEPTSPLDVPTLFQTA